MLRPRRWALACWVACAAMLVGCAGRISEEREFFGAPGFIVRMTDGTRLEGTPMHIQVSESLEVPAQASITAHAADGRTWSAIFGLSLSQVRGGRVSLQRRPLAEGIGMVGLGDPRGHLEDFDDGTLTFSLDSDRIATGRTTTTPSSGSATFSGRYILNCWVYPQTLGQPMNGEGDGEVRIEDADFTSPFCKQFIDLR